MPAYEFDEMEPVELPFGEDGGSKINYWGFKEGYYYTKAMQGSYSIKYVLPALFPEDENLDYHHLDMVHNGKEAMYLFKDMINRKENEVKKIRRALLAYCELDTYAMVKIWYKLKQVIDVEQKETMGVP